MEILEIKKILPLLLLSGCVSFWDDNQSESIINVRQAVHQLDCTLPQAPQIKNIKDNLQWLELYSDSKGRSQKDIKNLIAPISETIDSFYTRTVEQEGSTTYCISKKIILQIQVDSAASTVLGRVKI